MNKKKVAFICVHNSCRSQIAEALGITRSDRAERRGVYRGNQRNRKQDTETERKKLIIRRKKTLIMSKTERI